MRSQASLKSRNMRMSSAHRVLSAALAMLFISSAYAQTTCGKGEFKHPTLGCRPCADGFFQDAEEHTLAACKACPAGFYSKGEFSFYKESCTACESGTYQPKTGQSACLVCPDGQYQPAEGKTSCLTCKPGSYSKGTFRFYKDVCTLCEAGSYQPYSGRASCFVCPDGKWQNEEGKTTCKTCGPGTFSKGTFPYQKQACTACEPGTYQPSSGKPSCILCADGYFQNLPSATSCKACRAGTYTAGASTYYKSSCRLCDPGSFNNQTAQSKCIKCSGRTYQSAAGQTKCLACGAGRTLDALRTACTPCPAGTYQSVALVSTNKCYECSYKSYQPNRGQTSCVLCPLSTAARVKGSKSLAACERYLAGRVAFVEEFDQTWTYNSKVTKHKGLPLDRTATSGQLNNNCERTLSDGIQKTTCRRFAVFLKPDGSTLFLFDTSAGYSSCVLAKGVTTRKCLIYYVSQSSPGFSIEGVEYVTVSSLRRLA